MTVNITPRDIVFKFNNSCNCCGTDCCVKVKGDKSQKVYINSNGEIEEFDEAKFNGSIKEAILTSLINLNAHMIKRLQSFTKEIEPIKEKVLPVINEIRSKECIYYEQIEKINQIMLEHIVEKQTMRLPNE